jgi:hypothetical protein
MSLATPGCVQELQTASHASLIYPGGVCLFREPDAVTPPVRFDEREQETELGQTGLRRAKRKPSPTATGRLRPLRLFSTLPQIPSMSEIAMLRQLTGQQACRTRNYLIERLFS